MKRAVFVVIAVVLAVACSRAGARGAASTTQTATIAPAKEQPAPTGTDSLTQTTEVEDSRSEEDGGVTSPDATSTAKPPSTIKAPAKKKTKK